MTGRRNVKTLKNLGLQNTNVILVPKFLNEIRGRKAKEASLLFGKGTPFPTLKLKKRSVSFGTERNKFRSVLVSKKSGFYFKTNRFTIV